MAYNAADSEQAEIDMAIATLERTDPVHAAMMRRVATMLTALDQALAPYGLVPFSDTASVGALPTERDAVGTGEKAGYHVAVRSQGYTITDTSGQIIAQSIELGMASTTQG